MQRAKETTCKKKKLAQYEVPRGVGPRTLMFWKVAPCSLLVTDNPPPPKTLVRFFQAARCHVPADCIVNSTVLATDTQRSASNRLLSQIKDNQSCPNFHIIPPPNSTSPFILHTPASRDAHFSISCHCFLSAFKEQRCCYFPNTVIPRLTGDSANEFFG